MNEHTGDLIIIFVIGIFVGSYLTFIFYEKIKKDG